MNTKHHFLKQHENRFQKIISRALPSPTETHSESVNTVSRWSKDRYSLIIENTYSIENTCSQLVC